MHVLGLCMLFFCDKGKFHRERFEINATTLPSTIVFMPLQKRVEQKPVTPVHGQKQPDAYTKMSHHAYEKKIDERKQQDIAKKVSPAKKVVPHTKKAEKKAIAPQKAVAQIPAVKPVKHTQQAVQKKNNILEATKQTAIKPVPKSVEKTALAAKKLPEQQPVEKKEHLTPVQEKKIIATKKDQKLDQQEKIVEVTNVEKVQDVQDRQVVQPLKPIDEPKKSVLESDNLNPEEVTFVGSLDLEMIQIKEKIHQQVAHYYTPPVGLSKKALCELVVYVGSTGKAERITVKKSSGSIANDVSARAALLQVLFPKEVIGKEIIVELGQP